MGKIINGPVSNGVNHLNALNLLDLKIGDTVRVVTSAAGYTRGWENSWATEMHRCVGKEYKVLDIDPRSGVQLEVDVVKYNPRFPAFVLAKVTAVQKSEYAKTASSSSFAKEIDALEAKIESRKVNLGSLLNEYSATKDTYGPNTSYLLLG